MHPLWCPLKLGSHTHMQNTKSSRHTLDCTEECRLERDGGKRNKERNEGFTRGCTRPWALMTSSTSDLLWASHSVVVLQVCNVSSQTNLSSKTTRVLFQISELQVFLIHLCRCLKCSKEGTSVKEQKTQILFMSCFSVHNVISSCFARLWS